MSASEIWSRYVRYIGAGAVATAGILTVLTNFPTMAGAFLAVVRGVGGGPGEAGGDSAGPVARTGRDLPGTFVFGGIAVVVLAAALVPGIFSGHMGPLPRAGCAAGAGRSEQRR